MKSHVFVMWQLSSRTGAAAFTLACGDETSYCELSVVLCLAKDRHGLSSPITDNSLVAVQ
jgi:hypothetical protein